MALKDSKDDGSILVMALGLLVIAVLCIVTALNVATAWTGRNELDRIADGAALAGAQGVDAEAVYRNSLGTSLPLSRSAVETKVHAFVTRAQHSGLVSVIQVSSIQVQAATVQVTLNSRVSLPFGYLAPASMATVTSRARATMLLR